MSGPRQRGSAGPLKALELTEAGCASPFDARIMDSSRPRRRKVSRRNLGLTAVARAKIRRFLIRLQRQPLVLSQVLAYTVGIAILLGIIMAVSIRYMSFGTTTSHDRISVARRIKNYAATSLNRLPSRSIRKRDGQNLDTRAILISSILSAIGTFNHPSNNQFNKELGWFPDYGGLEIIFFEDPDARRFIAQDLTALKNEYREPDVIPDDDVDAYYFFDDDYLRGLDNVFPDE